MFTRRTGCFFILTVVSFLIISCANKQERLLGAAGNGDLETVKYLISNGANINCKNEEGESPLSYAIMWEHEAVVQYLVSNGADPNIRNNLGMTPLFMVHKPNYAAILLSHGANINAISNDGNTVLSYAISNAFGSVEGHLK
jgi:hypothetical protein